MTDEERSESSRPARRFTDEPDPEGWRAADVPDSERVDDAFIERDVMDPTTETKVYPPIQPEDERLFPPSEPSEGGGPENKPVVD